MKTLNTDYSYATGVISVLIASFMTEIFPEGATFGYMMVGLVYLLKTYTIATPTSLRCIGGLFYCQMIWPYFAYQNIKSTKKK